MKANPFAPNSPVPPGLFVGRQAELRQLVGSLVQTRAGAPRNFLLTGERGIGKSSLLNYTKVLAQGFETFGGESFAFLVVDTSISAATNLLGLIKMIELRMREELGKGERARIALADVWKFVQRIEAAGIRIHPEEKAAVDELLLEEFVASLASLSQRICDPEQAAGTFGRTYDGVLLLVDEADNASAALQLGSFCKLLMEGLQRRGCNCVMIGLAGLPHLPTVLVESHVSSIRIFEELPLEVLSTPEVQEVIETCLRIGAEKNSTPTKITTDAIERLVELSEGYPHFIQQFGYSSFDVDSDDVIDRKDVEVGASGKHGALENIGNRYYRQDIAEMPELSSQRILSIMSSQPGPWVDKKDIAAEYSSDLGDLGHALTRLSEKKVIVSKEGTPSLYKLQQKAFGEWLRMMEERRSTGESP